MCRQKTAWVGILTTFVILGCNGSGNSTENSASEAIPEISNTNTDTSASTTVDTSQLSALFAAPTQDEIATVKARWQQRDTQVQQWQSVAQGEHLDFTVDVISHLVNGEIHYALIRHPKESSTDQSAPVLIINHGGTGGVSINAIGRYSQNSEFDPYILLLPSFVGEALDTGSTGLGSFQSGGDISEFDWDIDSVIGMLSGALAQYPQANPDHISMVGGSRGGCVSYLVAIREPRIRRMVVFFGATDHLSYPELATTIPELIANPNASNPFFNSIKTITESYLDGDISLQEARYQLLEKSPLHFIDDLPSNLQIHHGALDSAVPVENSQRIDAAILNQLSLANYQYYEYPDGGHGDNMPNSQTRADEFILQGFYNGE